MSVISIVFLTAVRLAGQPAPVAIAIGDMHGVLLKSDGTVWTWGYDSHGQLGREDDGSLTPVQVPGLTNVRSVAAGDAYSMALRSDGTVWTWGQNKDGQLGNGGPQDSPRPVAVAGIPPVAAIAAGKTHALALHTNGTVWQWGVGAAKNTPVQIEKMPPAVAIAAGDEHSAALDREGNLWLWGYHGAGDLGDHNYDLSYLPRQVAGLTNLIAVAAGYHDTVALKKDGTVWAIGYGEAGQLGNGLSKTSTKPVMAVGLTGVKAVAARYMAVMALKSDGAVWGWGSNHDHQLGNPRVDSEDSNKPVRAEGLTGIVAIASGGDHSAAANARGEVWVWGSNQFGGLAEDTEELDHSDVPMHPGQEIPPRCRELFSCQATGGKVIRICGNQDESNPEKWNAINYRFGPASGPPELIFPADPENAPPSLFVSTSTGREQATVRFSSGGYTYRVYYGDDNGGGVIVQDARGKILSNLACIERPQMYLDYLLENLPHDARK